MIWATANANVALVKYWGKAPGDASSPATPSLSVTLEGLSTSAGVGRASGVTTDVIEGVPDGPAGRIREFLDAAREELNLPKPVIVSLHTNFPVAAGLASSASVFAALATAVAANAEVDWPPERIARLARRGSGSAARSLFAGFVELEAGPGGAVRAVAPPDHWSLEAIVAITREEPKEIGSREGMMRTASSSPYYGAWLAASREDLPEARSAIVAKNFESLARVSERNCMRMHAAALGADPPLLYWEPATIAVMEAVSLLRARGVPAFFTVDAGPQVKVFCERDHSREVEQTIGAVPGVIRTIRTKLGSAPVVSQNAPRWVTEDRARGGAAA